MRERKSVKGSIGILALNRPQMLDVEMDQIIGTIVDSLFSVCVTLGMKFQISDWEKKTILLFL